MTMLEKYNAIEFLCRLDISTFNIIYDENFISSDDFENNFFKVEIKYYFFLMNKIVSHNWNTKVGLESANKLFKYLYKHRKSY
jgi:hypothetical protein